MSVRSGLLACLFALSLSAQPLTQGERDRALSSLHGSRKMLVDSVAGLSAAQLAFKPAPDAWSIAEVIEHLALTEPMLFQLASVGVMKAPIVPPEQRAEARKKDEVVLTKVPDRSQKAEAPEQLRPAAHFKTAGEALVAFNDGRGRTLVFIRETQEPLRDHAMPHPLLGPLDGYQWVLLLGAHTERHTAQILEVKANPAFPKN
jgi:hypothetical protein